MKKIAAMICLMAILIPSSSFAYSRGSQGYTSAQSETEGVETPAEQKTTEEKLREIQQESSGGRMSGTMIMGYVMITVGGLAAIGGSTILATTDKRVLGASIAAGGAAIGLAGSMMVMFGSRTGYGVGPTVDPKSGTYGIQLAKRF